MNIYLREKTRNGVRQRSERFRFPVAQYSRQRFRMCSHISLCDHVRKTHFSFDGPIYEFCALGSNIC